MEKIESVKKMQVRQENVGIKSTIEKLKGAMSALSKYEDGVGGRKREIYKKQLKQALNEVPRLSAMGFDIEVESQLGHLGGTTITLRLGAFETDLLSLFYDRFSSAYGIDDMDPSLTAHAPEFAVKAARERAADLVGSQEESDVEEMFQAKLELLEEIARLYKGKK